MPDIPDGDLPARTHKSRRLCSNLCFRTYSDAKLAGLLIENNFPVTLFEKVFNAVVDPDFKSEDITFKDIWDIFEYVSARRSKDGMERDTAVAPLEDDHNDEYSKQREMRMAGGVPRDILNLVVDQLVDGRLPLGIAAMDPRPTNAFTSNSPDLQNMSLVHRSWTSAAQRGLRRRAVIPSQHIADFLLSSLCGPWITEMIIYWPFNKSNNGDIVGTMKDNIWALESLLERTPNIRSLVFTTSLVWNTENTGNVGHLSSDSRCIDTCLEIITDLLPNLENLWLKHHRPLTIEIPNERSFNNCCELRSLYHYLPKLSSLKYLSIRWWSSDDFDDPYSDSDSDRQLIWDEHPPPGLKTVDLYLSGDPRKDDLTWLLEKRGSFSLDSLSLYLERYSLGVPSSSRLQGALRDCLPEIKKLKLVIYRSPILDYRVADTGISGSVPGQFYSRLLELASNLKNLELFFFFGESDLRNRIIYGPFDLPPSLENLAIHLEDDRNHPSTPSTSTSAPASSDLQDLQVWFSMAIEKYILDHLPFLPHLRKILVTRSPALDLYTLEGWDLDALIPRMDDMGQTAIQRGIQRGEVKAILSEPLRTILEQRDVDFVFIDNAFPRGWDIPRRV
ncbi:uncharacterized protein FOMMEDRAFT_154378 [Fomitiporia mediterranea MF3/22]|uniref:uncharacterized protein n=1 Tax=Fomitiporia mediterranea (strain MF3/22) TaxID=694068 RepID=UPI000440873A|nr:uncharacterized protein FOMMEDRAFT_154378 [Fomitiporia mediterranea MF3/22]EJD05172.1 hypothetical protein FOMMEDRAFT_154378 [Fomitiporia mediterranea MF3/22]